jgi:ABC transporter DrrB family efflux protein
MFRGFRAIVYKEFIHVSRDPFTLFLMLLIPMLQMTIFGYAINTEVRDIETVVYDLDRRAAARELVDAFENTDYFEVVEFVASDAELDRAIVSGRAKVGIKIPPDYSDLLAAGRQAQVLVLIDGSDSSIATQSVTVAGTLGFRESLDRLASRLPDAGRLPIEVRPKMLFNPDSRSANFMVPGLVAIILQIITTLLTAFAVVREREHGTLDQLLVTPIRPLGLMLGKLAPYACVGFVELVSVLLVMRFVFDVPINGSLLLLVAFSMLFIVTALAIGLLISMKAKNQVQAMQLGMLIILPSVLLSGFMFPRGSMPVPMQVVGYLIPATHFVQLIRGIVLRGATASDLVGPAFALTALCAVLLALGVARFNRKLTG